MNHRKFLFACVAKNTATKAERYLNSLSSKSHTAAVRGKISKLQAQRWIKELGDASLRNAALILTRTSNYYGYGPLYRPRLVNLLSVAVWKGSLKMVDVLVRHGVDINASSVDEEYDFTTIGLCHAPIAVACAIGETAIAKQLLEHGADVTSHRGGNCLKRCFRNEELVRLLVAREADVNIEVSDYESFRRLPLLQLALQYEDLNVVRLLLDVGADPRLHSQVYGEDALQFMCRQRKRDAVDLLLGATGLGLKEQIEAYRLIGASWMNGDQGDRDDLQAEYDERDNDVTKATSYWIEAMDLQCSAQPTVAMDRPPVPLEAFGIAQEPVTVDELKDLLSRPYGPDMYAILLREQILGPHTFRSMKIMWRIARRLSASRQYARAIDLYNYLLQYTLTTGRVADRDRFYSIESYLYNVHESLNSWCHCGKHYSRDTGNTILTDFRHAHSLVRETYVQPQVIQGWVEAGLELLEKLMMKVTTLGPAVEYSCYEFIECKVNEILATIDHSKEMCLVDCYTRILYFLLVLDVMLKLSMNIAGKSRLHRITVELMRSCSASLATGPLLCYAARDRRTVSPDVFQYLLQCSGDLLLRDVHCGLDEALLVLADELHDLSVLRYIDPLEMNRFESDIRSYALMLLKSGAHADVKNSRGERLCTAFNQRFPDFNPFPFETLQCLAARAVSRLADPLLSEKVPKMMVDFVNVH